MMLLANLSLASAQRELRPPELSSVFPQNEELNDPTEVGSLVDIRT